MDRRNIGAIAAKGSSKANVNKHMVQLWNVCFGSMTWEAKEQPTKQEPDSCSAMRRRPIDHRNAPPLWFHAWRMQVTLHPTVARPFCSLPTYDLFRSSPKIRYVTFRAIVKAHRIRWVYEWEEVKREAAT